MLQQPGVVNPQNPNNDTIVANSPSDTINSLQFCPPSMAGGNFLLAAGWSKEVCVYEVALSQQGSIATQPKAKVTHSHPVLTAAWSGDGSAIFSGGSDNQIKMWNLGAAAGGGSATQEVVVAQHAAPIKSVHHVTEMGVIVTGSYDKTIKYWDLRQSNPVASIQLNERVYAMDVKYPVLAVATATVPENVVDRGVQKVEKKNKVFIYNLQGNPSQPFRTVDSPLKFQHRCLEIFPDKTGFAVGSVEGRVAISHVQEKDLPRNFAFKCHRQGDEIYAVNAISFHPYGTFATAGSDGVYTFWDKDAKQRLKLFSRSPNGITAATFNPAGNIYAYALGYDWSKGVEYYQRQKDPCTIMLHATPDAEIAKKNVAKK